MMPQPTLRACLLAALVAACLPGASPSSAAPMTPTRAPFFAAGPQAALEQGIRADDAAAIARALAGGARVDARGPHGVTPLMIAVDAQRPQAVVALLRAGAAPNDKAADRNGVVSLAIRNHLGEPSGREILQAVLRAGGDPDTRRPDDDPVIFQFIDDHDVQGLRMLKSFGADIDIRDRAGDPLITSVAMAQDWDMVWALIELGARFDYENGAARRPLSLSLGLAFPAPDSPLFADKYKVWQLLKDKGLPVKPLKH